MANVKKGNITAPVQRWKHMDVWKRIFWKGERQAWKAGIAERLEDDYTHEEFMADICTPEEPCDLCKTRVARHKTPNAEVTGPRVGHGSSR